MKSIRGIPWLYRILVWIDSFRLIVTEYDKTPDAVNEVERLRENTHVEPLRKVT